MVWTISIFLSGERRPFRRSNSSNMSLTFLWSARSSAIASCCRGLALRPLRLEPPLRLLAPRRLVPRVLLRLLLLRLAPLLFERLLLEPDRLRFDCVFAIGPLLVNAPEHHRQGQSCVSDDAQRRNQDRGCNSRLLTREPRRRARSIPTRHRALRMGM